MTAVNAYLTPSRGYLMTDASMYTPQGLIVGFGQKAVAMPSLGAAIAIQGVQRITALLAMEMSITFGSMDHLMHAREDYLGRILRNLSLDLCEGLDQVRLVCVGWSDKHRKPVGFYYDSLTDEGDEIDGYVMAPMPDDEQDEILKRERCLIDVNLRMRDFDPVRHGVPIMEAQRRMRIIPPSTDMEEGISIVGGHALVTEVSRTGVKQYVAHQWPDVIGEHIDPTPVKVSAQSQINDPLNRQQRRAMAQQLRTPARLN